MNLLEANVDRRTLLMLGILTGLTSAFGCATKPARPTISSIRREVGTWSQSDVETLARAMTETSLPNVSLAGSTLLDNQGGQPSFSNLSPMFNDKKLVVITVASLAPAPDLGYHPTSVKARIYEETPRVHFNLNEKATGKTLPISAGPSLSFRDIQLDNRLANKYSDFYLAFLLAQSVLNVKAFDMVSTYVTTKSIYNKYSVPAEDNFQKAVRVSAMESAFGNVPSSQMANLWSYFLLAPDYSFAVDHGMFTKQEDESEAINIIKYSALAFQKSNTLNKNSQGEYEWIQDPDKFYADWISFATVVYNSLKQGKPLI